MSHYYKSFNEFVYKMRHYAHMDLHCGGSKHSSASCISILLPRLSSLPGPLRSIGWATSKAIWTVNKEMPPQYLSLSIHEPLAHNSRVFIFYVKMSAKQNIDFVECDPITLRKSVSWKK